jgi:RNA recognition motif-containing protein
MGKNTIYVCHLPFKVCEDSLRELFAPFGEIKEITIPTEQGCQRTRGFGFIEYADSKSAEKAVVAMDGKEVTIDSETRQLSVSIAEDKEKSRGRGGRW